MRIIATLALFAALVTPALAEPADDYKALRLAASLDDLCHVFKFVERKAIDQVSFAFIRQTSEHGLYQSDRMPPEKYFAFLDNLDATADAQAAAIGCTQAAEAHLLMARGVASADIMQRLMLAFHFHGLPDSNYNRLPLNDDLVAGATSYQALLQQLFGDQYTTFVEQQRQRTIARLPPMALLPTCDFLTPPDVECADESSLYDPEVSRQMSQARQDAFLIHDVLLEVAAETAGYAFRTSYVQKVNLAGTLVDKAGAAFGTVVDNGRTFRLEGGGEIAGVMVEAANGQLRLVTYGTAAEQLRPGLARLFIRSEPKPDGVEDWQVANLADFRSLTFPFDGVLLAEKCLGGPCFEFPHEATEAILQTGFAENLELWLSADAAAVTPATRDWATANIVRPQLLRRLRGETDKTP